MNKYNLLYLADTKNRIIIAVNHKNTRYKTNIHTANNNLLTTNYRWTDNPKAVFNFTWSASAQTDIYRLYCSNNLYEIFISKLLSKPHLTNYGTSKVPIINVTSYMLNSKYNGVTYNKFYAIFKSDVFAGKLPTSLVSLKHNNLKNDI